MKYSRVLAAAAAPVLMLGATIAPGYADDISNNLDGTIDATAEAMPLNVGGTNGTTTLYVQPQGGDGKSGCNLTGGTTATFSVSSSNPGAATVSPSSVTFDSCGATRTLTVTPVAVGSTSVTLTQTANTSGGSFNIAPATFTVDVAPPANTAPTIAVTGVTAGDSYQFGSVPAAGCQVTDTEDGNSTKAAALSVVSGPYSALGIGQQTAVCTYTDAGGLMASSSATYNIVPVPNTKPTVTVSAVADGGSYPKGNVPTAMCNVADAEDDPVASFIATLSAVTGPYASDGIGSQTASCSYLDDGDITGQDRLSDTHSVTYSIIDTTAPDIDHTLTPSAPDGDNDWYVSAVSLDWTVTEDESPSSLSKTGCTNVDITSDQAEQSYSCSASSAGGSSGPVTVSIKRDATAPSLDVTGGPADGGSYFFGSVPGAPTCSASDNLSGVAAPCAVSGYEAGVGQHTVTISVKDNAGNTATVTRNYEVKAWTLSGFYAPVDLKGVVNTVKGGSTVPLKFELFAGTTELTDVSAVKSFTTQKINCDGSAPQDALEMTTTGGTSLRYDSTAGQFIQNWKTPTGAGQCYQATMTAQDDSTISALFKLK